MRGSAPLVSVVIPAFNAERTIGRTLESVLGQTYANIEVLIVDDGSSDGTAAVAQEFCSADGRARLLAKANGGVASARNLGIAQAKGEWIAPIDADDLWHPTKIDKQVAAAAAARETPGFVYCWSRLVDDADRIIGSSARFELEGNVFPAIAYLNPVRNGSALLISRSAALAVGGYDESLRAQQAQGCEDVMIQLQLARRFPLGCVAEHLVGYRVSGDMSSDLAQIGRSWRLVYDRIAAEDPRLARRTLRRVRARSAFEEAQLEALAGRMSPVLPSLARAIALDPVRSGMLLLCAAARAIGRNGRATGQGLNFYGADPRKVIDDESGGLSRLAAGLLHALEKRRLNALAGPHP